MLSIKLLYYLLMTVNNSVAEISPSLKIRGISPVTSTTVEPVPPFSGPASKAASSCRVSCGLRSPSRRQPDSPDRLALVPVIGLPRERIRAAATGWPGSRIPILPVPAVRRWGTASPALNTSVTLPGQKWSIMQNAAKEARDTSRSSCLR